LHKAYLQALTKSFTHELKTFGSLSLWIVHRQTLQTLTSWVVYFNELYLIDYISLHPTPQCYLLSSYMMIPLIFFKC